jgi:hypothetical protein
LIGHNGGPSLDDPSVSPHPQHPRAPHGPAASANTQKTIPAAASRKKPRPQPRAMRPRAKAQPRQEYRASSRRSS